MVPHRVSLDRPVCALSHSAQFGKHTNLLRAIASAMEEALDQQATIAYAAVSQGPPLVTQAHAALAEQHGSRAICTLLLKNSNGL